MNMNTADRTAVRILLSNATGPQKQRALAALATKVRDLVNGVCSCPVCGTCKAHENNGYPEKHYEYTLLCTDCGAQWAPNR